MGTKAKCYIQVSGETKGLHGKTISTMRDWIAFVPDPVELLDVSIEALRFCKEQKIVGGEVVHYQKIGVVEHDD